MLLERKERPEVSLQDLSQGRKARTALKIGRVLIGHDTSGEESQSGDYSDYDSCY